MKGNWEKEMRTSVLASEWTKGNEGKKRKKKKIDRNSFFASALFNWRIMWWIRDMRFPFLSNQLTFAILYHL